MTTPFPLGRHPDAAEHHDPRSRNFAARADLPVKTKYWRRYGDVLDQGNLGSCTGNAAAGCLNHVPFHATGAPMLTETDAVRIYSTATTIDPFTGRYPPTDTGSDGLSVAKVVQREGRITAYQHAFSLDHVLSTLMLGPLIVGVPWMNDMFYPEPNGIVRPTGGEAGGHEICLDGVNITHKWLRFTNSWSEAWGIGGRFYMYWADFGTLLAQGGDAVLFVR